MTKTIYINHLLFSEIPDLKRMDSPLLVVWPEFPPSTGGMQVHGVEFAKFLFANNIQFFVVTNEPSCEEEEIESREIDQILGFSPLRVLPRNDFTASMKALEQICKELAPRAVFSSQVSYAPAFRNIKKVVCRSAGNDLLRPWVGPYNIAYEVMRKLPFEEQRHRLEENRRWVCRASKKCALILCNSKWTAQKLEALNINNTFVLLGGVNVDEFQPIERLQVREAFGWSLTSKIALIAARHVLKKGIDLAIEAISLLKDFDCQLVILGSGPETNNLRGLCYELDVVSNVKFIGNVPHSLLPRYIAASDVVLAPSRNVYDPRKFAIDYETMGRILCEAAACGVPTIASNVAGIPEIIKDGETGILVKPNDPTSLADAILKVLFDEVFYKEAAFQSRIWAMENLSFDLVNKKTLQWIEG